MTHPNPTARRRQRMLIAAASTIGALGLTSQAGAQALDTPVSYEVGQVEVFGTRTRNESCSLTRHLQNNGDTPVQVAGHVYWEPDGLEPVPPNQGQFRGVHTLQPGERTWGTWTNTGHIPDGPVFLVWTVTIPDGTAQIGINDLEQVPACHPTTTPTTAPETSTPAPPPVSSPGSEATPPPPPAEGGDPPPVAPPPGGGTTTNLCTADCGDAGRVLTSTRTELAHTGMTGTLASIGIALGLSGLAATLTGRLLKRRNAAYPATEDNQETTR